MAQEIAVSLNYVSRILPTVKAISGVRLDALETAIREIEKVVNVDFVAVDTYSRATTDLFIADGAFGLSYILGGAIMPVLNPNLPNLDKFSGLIMSEKIASANLAISVMIHELGHVLGLRHPGLQQGNEDIPYLPASQAIFANTIMAYVDAAATSLVSPRSSVDSLFLSAGLRPEGLQIYDIRALQEVYGANTEANNGDDVYDYTLNNRDGYHTIYDRGGNDLLNFGLNSDESIRILDLTPGTRSKINGATDFVIADDTYIENVIGTLRADVIYGNREDNIFEGGGGADTLDGRSGIDTASYKHSLMGVSVDLTRAMQESPAGVTTDATGDMLISIENLIGSSFDDVLVGNRDNNRIDGGTYSADVMAVHGVASGYGGNDILTGGGGRDTFVVDLGWDRGHDIITDFQRGLDKLFIRVDAVLEDLSAAIANNFIGLRSSNAHMLELYLPVAEGEEITDYITINFLDSLADIIDYTADKITVSYNNLESIFSDSTDIVTEIFAEILPDTNEAPTDITIGDSEGANIIYEIGDGTIIGTLTAIDPDKDDNPYAAFNIHEFTLSGVNSNLFEIVVNAGVATLQFKTAPDSNFRYIHGGNELTLTITATDNPGADESDRISYEKTFTINVDEETFLRSPRAVIVDENGYFTFMQKGTISETGAYIADNDDLYLMGEPTKIVSATLTVTRGSLDTGQKLKDYSTSNPDDYFMVKSVSTADNHHQLTFENIQLQDLSALLEGLIYYAPDGESKDPATFDIIIKDKDENILAESATQIGIRAIDDPSSIIGLDNYLIHQDLVNTLRLSTNYFSYGDISKHFLAGAGAGAWVRLDHTDGSVGNDKGRIKDIDGYTVVGSNLHIRVDLDDTVKVARADATHIRVRDAANDGKVVYEVVYGNPLTSGRTEIHYRYMQDNRYFSVKVGEKSITQLDNSDGFDYHYTYTFNTAPSNYVAPAQIDGEDVTPAEAWEELQKEVLDAILHNLEYTSGGFTIGQRHSTSNIPVLDESLITIQFEDAAVDKFTDEVAVRVIDDRGADIANGGHDLIVRSGRAVRESDFVDGSVIPVRVDYTQDPKDRLAKEIKSFINEDNKFTRTDTSSTADDNGEGPTIIRYYMPTAAEIYLWQSAVNGNEHTIIPSVISDNDKRIIEQYVLSQFERIANIEFEAVTNINTQRPDIVFIKGYTIKVDGVYNDDINAKTVIQESVNIPGPLGVQKLPTIFFKRPNDVRYDKNTDPGLSHELARELGYALGLRNPTSQLGDEGLSYLPYAEVSFANTIYGLEDIQSGKRLDPQGYDIAALQELYDPRNAEYMPQYSRHNFYENYWLSYSEQHPRGSVVFGTGATQTIDLADGGYSGLPFVKYALHGIDAAIQRLVSSSYGGNDNLLGDAHDNLIRGREGADTLDGRAGIDEAFYNRSGVTVDLRKKIQDSPEDISTEVTGDILINIENLRGTGYDNTLIGNNDHNRLDGGNSGDDTLTGNGGRDTFIVNFGPFAGHDIITDFERGIDKLEIDAPHPMYGLAAFRAAIGDTITLSYEVAEDTPSGHAIKISHSIRDYRGRVVESSITINFQDSIADAVDLTADEITVSPDDLIEALGGPTALEII